MPPIIRRTWGPVEAPADLADAIRRAGSAYIDEDDGWPDDDLPMIRRLRELEPHGGDRHDRHTYNGEVLSAARMTLDYLASYGEECHDYAAGYGLEPPPSGQVCFECTACLSCVVRDRIDLAFDRAGVPVPPYLGRTEPAIEDLWAACDDGSASWWHNTAAHD